MSYEADRKAAIAEFEYAWLKAKLEQYHGNVSLTAKSENVDRVYLHKLMRRHGVHGNARRMPARDSGA